jgi:hypothetical protein
MLRPLPLDLLTFLLPLSAGALAFVLGRSFRRWPRALRIGTVVLALAVVAAGATSLARILPSDAGLVMSWLGGPTVLLSGVALLLLGVVWGVPNRSLSSGFLAALTALAGCLLLIETSGRLWWRFCAAQAWQRSADAEGCLQQSSGLTCSPAAAVMLLHRHGISSTEGEMAYLAGTSLFGTDAHSMTRALRWKAQPHGWQAEVRQTDYEACVRQTAPFVAHVTRPSLGHALLVEKMSADQVEVLDPLDGRRRKMSRADFEQVWDGTAIQLVRPGE